MSTPNHDPNANLLFGILALQNDFVSREDFLAASSRWMQDKSRALSDILVEIGALSSADHALLKPLVERHIQAHGGDATVSLRNLSSLGPLGDELRTIVDSEVEASLAVVGKDRSNRDYHATIPPSAGATTSTGSRFRVLRPHKGGGLGFVSVAYDDELHREVALKQIREKYADHVDQRSRFLLEAEITGGLEHPAIVPVYGLGHYPDGRPFYAMKFVRGDNLKDAVQRFHASPSASQQMREGGVELRKLLERFLDVCDAVHYAHSRGVLHRDLKPGNVMLGNYGETLVVDWGLAKPRTETPERSLSDEGTLNPPSASGTAAELPGQVVGTPEYMPPEQAEGQLSRMDARSDVYSLGATLYYLLVNQPPFSDPNVEVVLEKVRRGELKPPREINPQVPQALEAICLKAMHRDQTARYENVQALRDDLGRWLADEPVRAWTEPWSVRTRRWIKHHQSTVAGVASAATAAIVLLSIGLVLLTAANQRERLAKQTAEENFQLAEAAKQKAEENFQIAERAKQAAEENFQLAVNTVNEYFTSVTEETLLNEPGMQPLREDLLDKARTYYEQFVQARGDDDSLQVETGLAHYRLGRIQELLQQPGVALEQYAKARLIQQKLVDAKSTDVTAKLNLSDAINAIGRVHQQGDDFAQARQEFTAAYQLRQEAADADSTSLEAGRRLANSIMNLGQLDVREGDQASGDRRLAQAQDIRNRLIDAGQTDRHLRRDLAFGFMNIGYLRADQGRSEDALNAYQSAIAVYEKLRGEFPSDIEFQKNLALSRRAAGSLEAQLHPSEPQAALSHWSQSLSLMEDVASRNPAVTQYALELAQVHMEMGEFLFRNSQWAAAEQSFRQAAQAFADLPVKYPQLPAPNRRDVAVTLLRLGLTLSKQERFDEARVILPQAQSLLVQLDNEGVGDAGERLAEVNQAIDALAKP